jgi:D-alanyl-D-alanine carboxypeptidase/D-alanyl-D-alanine-endopeptidase (penicillin-binding protein 4)
MLKFALPLLFLTILQPVISSSGSSSRASDTTLKDELSRIFKDRRFSEAQIGAEVYSLNSNQELFSLHATDPMIPASVLKLYTAAAALKELGPEYTFKTEVLAQPHTKNDSKNRKLKKGVLNGDLYFKGSGDPSLVDERLDLLARDVRKSGLRVVTGQILVDDFAFEPPVRATARKAMDTSRAFNAPVGALNLDYNSVELDGRPKLLGAESARPIYRSIPDPAIHAGEALIEALKMQGIRVMHPEVARKQTPVNALVVGSVDSLPLREIVVLMNKYSNNFIADTLVRALALHRSPPPATLENGLAIVREYATKWKASRDVIFESGSGLQRENRATPDSFIQLLKSTSQEFGIFPELISSLPLAGRDGTLKRLKNVPDWGVVRAKSGSLDGVTSLVGVTQGPKGDTRLFAVIINLPHPEPRDLLFWEEDFLHVLISTQ